MAISRILVIGPAWVGDMVMAQVLLKILRCRFPDSQIDLVASPSSAALGKRMPEVQQIFTLPCQHGEWGWRKRLSLAKELKEAVYEQAYVLPNSWKSALIPWLARIPHRVGWLGEMRVGLLNDWRRLDKKKFPWMIERFAALGNQFNPIPRAQIPLPALQYSTMAREHLIQQYDLNLSRPRLVLAPGAAFGPAKIWPARYFAMLAQTYLAQGWDVWLIGAPSDAAYGAEIQQITQTQCHNFIGKTTLVEAIDLLSLATAVVCNDSGMMHIACALEKPVVAIFGSTSPQFTPPLGKQSVILQKQLACQPCFQRTCRYGHYQCLQQLTPDQVILALTQQLKEACLFS